MTKEQRNTYDESIERNFKSLWFIMQGVAESIYPKIEASKNAKEARGIMETTYQGTTKEI